MAAKAGHITPASDSRRPCIRIATASATSTNKSTPTIGGAPLSNRTDASAQSNAGARRNSMAGPRDKARQYAQPLREDFRRISYAPRDSASTDRRQTLASQGLLRARQAAGPVIVRELDKPRPR